MMILLLLVVLALNFGISWGNAVYAGRSWSESKQIGGVYRAYIVSGYIMSIAGFTMIYSYALLIIAPIIMELANMDSEIIHQIQQLSSDLMYVILVASIIPVGFFIWFKSVITFWQKKNLANGLCAGWNTLAQAHNVVTAARNTPSALGRIGKALFGGKGKKKADTIVIAAAIFIVICAISGGYFTASYIMKKADREFDLYNKVTNN